MSDDGYIGGHFNGRDGLKAWDGRGGNMMIIREREGRE